MESLAAIADKSLQTCNSKEEITNDLERDLRREKLYTILTEYREANQYAPLNDDDMELRIASWMPVTAPVPVARLHDCYVWAMQNRSNQFPLAATEIVDAWKHLQQRAETEGSSSLRDDRLLPENAAAACVRCDKLGREIHLDGSIGGVCDHRPFTEEEKQEASRIKMEMLAEAQREARKRVEIRRQEELKKKEEAQKPKEHHLFCSNCNRRVSTLAGWQAGEACGIKLDKESSICPKCQTPTGVQSLNKMVCRECFTSYDVVICGGKFSAH
jgi:hypothetical protein